MGNVSNSSDSVNILAKECGLWDSILLGMTRLSFRFKNAFRDTLWEIEEPFQSIVFTTFLRFSLQKRIFSFSRFRTQKMCSESDVCLLSKSEIILYNFLKLH